ncbi:hypothetical protein Bbelb_060340 [Branchiostoma belcheri]|nr:hypothetical protein Bbelb_060340 [Branchiostoma belcheri]
MALDETRWHLEFTELHGVTPRSPTIRMRNEKLIQFPANSHDMTAGRQEGVLHLMNEVYNCPPIRGTQNNREWADARTDIDNRLWIYVSFSATRATGKLTIYKLCDSNHLNWTCTSIVCITQTLLSAALLAPPAGCWAADRAQQKEGETRRRRTTHSSSDMEKGIGTSRTRTERDQETRTNKPFRNTRARAQIVHVKPPPDTPSSFEATDVYIPGPETSVPDPDRTVGRGQKVSLRRVPDYDKRLLETCGHAK